MQLFERISICVSPGSRLRLAEKFFSQGDYVSAISTLYSVLRVKPHSSKAHLLAGQATAFLKKYTVAKKHFRNIIPSDSTYSIAMFGLGNVSFFQGNIEEAIENYCLALDSGLQNFAIWKNLAECYRKQNNFIKMKRAAEKLVAIDPKNGIGHYLIGEALRDMGDPKLARKSYRKALEHSSDPTLVFESMAWLLQNFFEEKEALEFVCAAINSDNPRVLNVVADIFAKNFKYSEAEESYRKAISCNGDKAKLWTSLGIVLRDATRVDESLDCFSLALETDPDYMLARWHRSLAYLLKYEFSKAWEDYEYRRVCLDGSLVRPVPVQEWGGPSDKCKKLLVYAEQGLGDEIMFASCIPELRDDGFECVIECSVKLKELYAESFKWAKITTSQLDTVSLSQVLNLYTDIDRSIPIGSLPKFYRSSENWSPLKTYLNPSVEKCIAWREKLNELGEGLKIGFSWRGGTDQSGAGLRTTNLAMWENLFHIPGCIFISMQYGEVEEEIELFNKNNGTQIIYWRDAIDDYHETAAITKELDLIVSVPTSLAHLAGAVGTKSFVMVPFGPEWRFGSKGETMRWHPSLELLRQHEIGVWDDVFLDVGKKIMDLKKNSDYQLLEKS